ncbi:MAG: class I SAM-dependent methyltransferase [Deltaproteobacteria bacterium]|jgi:trans-aconitate methyltransferase|nr:class I SAM-dependent methyltransferase [Deltaproteobacteria bacterium]
MPFDPNQLLNSPLGLHSFKPQAAPVPPIAPKEAEEIVSPPAYDKAMYRDAYSRLGLLSIANVADLGCGCGNFTGVMVEKRQKPEVYIGVDFSHSQIKIAKAAYPGWNFIYGDFTNPQVIEKYERYEAYLLLHVLDTMPDELPFLESIPEGKKIIFSMPRAEREGSLRYFPDNLSLKNRYSGILNIRSVGSFKTPQDTFSMVLAERW